jgi:3-hydroxyacyl-[acyl-carrier-protein] dehydratase
VVKKELILDPSEYDLNHVLAGVEEIRRFNPQRHEMEQLTAVVFEDLERLICVGYKDLSPEEFWVRGHMPGMPLMPGVIMCEVAAQLASYFALKNRLMDAEMVGFGGLKEVRFRGMVQTGERFVIVERALKLRSSLITCEFQCLVRDSLVCQGTLMGIALPRDLLASRQA